MNDVLKEQAYKAGVKYFGVASDRAGVLVGNEQFRTVVFNDCGEDGLTFVIIDSERKINPGNARCVAVLEGKFNIYESDCQTDEIMATLDGTIDGFFVYYDDDLNEETGVHTKELRFTPLSKNGDPLPTLYLCQNNSEEICIKDSINAIFNETNNVDVPRYLQSMGMNPVFPADKNHQTLEKLSELAAQMISFVLYLSAVNADMKRDPTAPFKRTKHIQDIAREVEHIHVGDEVAVRIRTMTPYRSERTDAEPLGGHHRSPITHVRRAHWHTFRVGEGRKKTQIKWLAPMVVNAEGEQTDIVTVQKVEK